MTQPAQSAPLLAPEDVEDFLAEAIADSFDEDWRAADGARQIMHALDHEGYVISPAINPDRLALNLRAYAHSRGAPEREDDQEAALTAARELLAAFAGSV